MTNIIKQKEIAKEVLHKLECADPHCILAGGAPRNWFMGKEANDLDFYVHLDETMEATRLRFKRLGLDVKHVDFNSSGWEEYGIMQDLFRIYEGYYKNIKIQIMCMRKSTFRSVVPCFGVSICEFWWKGNKVVPTNNALVSLLNKTLYVKSNYSAKELHVKKMVDYFPTFIKADYGRLKDHLLLSLSMEEFYDGGMYYYNQHLYNKVVEMYDGYGDNI